MWIVFRSEVQNGSPWAKVGGWQDCGPLRRLKGKSVFLSLPVSTSFDSWPNFSILQASDSRSRLCRQAVSLVLSLWLSLFLLRGRSGFDGPLSNSGQSPYPRTSTLNSLCISAPSPCVTRRLHGLQASGRGHLGRVLVWLLSLLFIDSFTIGYLSPP